MNQETIQVSQIWGLTNFDTISLMKVNSFLTERDLGKPKYDLDRTDPLENSYTPVSSVTNISSGHYPVPTLSSTITVIAPAHHGNNTTESWSEFHEEQLDHNSYGRPPLPKKRCRDYDGR